MGGPDRHRRSGFGDGRQEPAYNDSVAHGPLFAAQLRLPRHHERFQRLFRDAGIRPRHRARQPQSQSCRRWLALGERCVRELKRQTTTTTTASASTGSAATHHVVVSASTTDASPIGAAATTSTVVSLGIAPIQTVNTATTVAASGSGQQSSSATPSIEPGPASSNAVGQGTEQSHSLVSTANHEESQSSPSNDALERMPVPAPESDNVANPKGESIPNQNPIEDVEPTGEPAGLSRPRHRLPQHHRRISIWRSHRSVMRRQAFRADRRRRAASMCKSTDEATARWGSLNITRNSGSRCRRVRGCTARARTNP